MPDDGGWRAPVVRVTGLSKDYHRRGVGADTRVRAVDDLNLTINRGCTLGLVGESSCGKTTLARAMLRLIEPTAGRVELAISETRTVDLTALGPRELRHTRRYAQMVFQDPLGSLNPRHTVREIVTEPLLIHRLTSPAELETRARELADLVGLDAAHLDHRGPELSGGERQRVAIARAIATRPRLLVADEPVAALDVSVQGQVLNCLRDLQAELSLTMLFISHDLAVIRQMADRVAVMHRGRIVETGPTQDVFERPAHPQTARLIAHSRGPLYNQDAGSRPRDDGHV